MTNWATMVDSKVSNGEMPILFVDTHVHIYDVYDIDRLFDAAVDNFAAAARKNGCGEAPRQLMLLLTETAQDHAFSRLKSGALRPSRWRVEPTLEDAVLRVSRDAATAIWLVAGRQIATREDLEVAVLGTTAEFPEGQPIRTSVEAADRLGAMTALPWGFGKWWGERGRLITSLMRGPRSKPLFLGDNGGRLALSTRPSLLTEGEGLGHRVLPGSDPLPFPGEERKVGSYGIMLHEWDAGDRPLQRLVEVLGNRPGSPQPFGRLTGIASFLRLQFGMQVRKRLRRAPA
jgi:hypothetical protein